MLPSGREGAVRDQPPYDAVEAVCPSCQYVEWHPHCTSLLDAMTGERIDAAVEWAAMPPEERDYSRLMRCEYIDTTVAWTDDDYSPPASWRCPRCGGTTFEAVHRDYLPSGLSSARFSVEGADVEDADEYNP